LEFNIVPPAISRWRKSIRELHLQIVPLLDENSEKSLPENPAFLYHSEIFDMESHAEFAFSLFLRFLHASRPSPE